MGTSRSSAEFAGKIRRAADAVAKARKDALLKTGTAMEHEFDRAVAADLGGDNTFSGWPKAVLVSGSKLQGDSGLSFAPTPRSLGPTRVAQQGRHAGMSGPMQGPGLGGLSKKTGRALKGRKRGKWNGTTQGKGTWDDTIGSVVAKQVIPEKIRPAMTAAMKEVFR